MKKKNINLNIGTLIMFLVMLGRLITGTEATMTELCICVLVASNVGINEDKIE